MFIPSPSDLVYILSSDFSGFSSISSLFVLDICLLDLLDLQLDTFGHSSLAAMPRKKQRTKRLRLRPPSFPPPPSSPPQEAVDELPPAPSTIEGRASAREAVGFPSFLPSSALVPFSFLYHYVFIMLSCYFSFSNDRVV